MSAEFLDREPLPATRFLYCSRCHFSFFNVEAKGGIPYRRNHLWCTTITYSPSRVFYWSHDSELNFLALTFIKEWNLWCGLLSTIEQVTNANWNRHCRQAQCHCRISQFSLPTGSCSYPFFCCCCCLLHWIMRRKMVGQWQQFFLVVVHAQFSPR